MAEQLVLDLPVRAATGRDAFLVAPPNASAVAQIDGWRRWPGGKHVLTGPEGSGKSHLAAVWALDAGATIHPADALPDPGGLEGASVVVEDVDARLSGAAAERRLLHLHNVVVAGGGRLLLTGRTTPEGWAIALPDLASRLRATPASRIDPPDDALLAGVLVKLFEDRQLAVTPATIHYVLPRMERSFAAARAFVAEMDRRALATGRPPGRRLAAEVLDAAGAGGH